MRPSLRSTPRPRRIHLILFLSSFLQCLTYMKLFHVLFPSFTYWASSFVGYSCIIFHVILHVVSISTTHTFYTPFCVFAFSALPLIPFPHLLLKMFNPNFLLFWSLFRMFFFCAQSSSFRSYLPFIIHVALFTSLFLINFVPDSLLAMSHSTLFCMASFIPLLL